MTPKDQPPTDMKLQLNAIQRGVETNHVYLQTLDQRLDRIAALLEATIQQIGILSENITRLEIQTEKIARTADQQSASVAALSNLASQMLQRIPL